jgi:hypothetical protein
MHTPEVHFHRAEAQGVKSVLVRREKGVFCLAQVEALLRMRLSRSADEDGITVELSEFEFCLLGKASPF